MTAVAAAVAVAAHLSYPSVPRLALAAAEVPLHSAIANATGFGAPGNYVLQPALMLAGTGHQRYLRDHSSQHISRMASAAM